MNGIRPLWDPPPRVHPEPSDNDLKYPPVTYWTGSHAMGSSALTILMAKSNPEQEQVGGWSACRHEFRFRQQYHLP